MGEYSQLINTLKNKSRKYYHFKREDFPKKGSIIVRPISKKGELIKIPYKPTDRDTVIVRLKKSHPFKTKHWVTSSNLKKDLVCFVEGDAIRDDCIAIEITSITEKVVFGKQIKGDKKSLTKFYNFKKG